MNDAPVPIGQNSFHHMYNGKPVTQVYSDRPGTIHDVIFVIKRVYVFFLSHAKMLQQGFITSMLITVKFGNFCVSFI